MNRRTLLTMLSAAVVAPNVTMARSLNIHPSPFGDLHIHRKNEFDWVLPNRNLKVIFNWSKKWYRSWSGRYVRRLESIHFSGVTVTVTNIQDIQPIVIEVRQQNNFENDFRKALNWVRSVLEEFRKHSTGWSAEQVLSFNADSLVIHVQHNQARYGDVGATVTVHDSFKNAMPDGGTYEVEAMLNRFAEWVSKKPLADYGPYRDRIELDRED